MLQRNATAVFGDIPEGVPYLVVSQEKIGQADEDLTGRTILLIPDDMLPAAARDGSGDPVVVVIERIEPRKAKRLLIWVRDVDAIGPGSLVREDAFPPLPNGGVLIHIDAASSGALEDGHVCYVGKSGLSRHRRRPRDRIYAPR